MGLEFGEQGLHSVGCRKQGVGLCFSCGIGPEALPMYSSAYSDTTDPALLVPREVDSFHGNQQSSSKDPKIKQKDRCNPGVAV